MQHLQEARGPLEQHWRQIAHYVHPNRSQGSWQINRQGDLSQSSGVKQSLFDSTAPLAADALANGLFALLTNPAMDWFELKGDDGQPGGEAGAGKNSAARLEANLKAVIELRANALYSVLPDLFRDLVCFGTAVLSVEADPRPGRVRLDVRDLMNLYLAADEAGSVSTVFRQFTLSAEQIAQRYPQSMPKNVAQAMAEGRHDDRFELVHVVLPRRDHQPHGVGAKALAYESLVIDPIEAQVLHQGGYHEMPYLVVRWSMASGKLYGEGPASLALPDVRALNTMVQTNLTAAQKAVDPPIMAIDENGLRGLKTHPGSVIYGGLDSTGRRMIEPFPTSGQIGLGLELEEQRRVAIRDAFHNSLLREVSERATQTATEFLGRQEERLRLLAPNLGRVESELLEPLVRRLAAILYRKGEVDVQLPLQAQGAEIRFLSPLAQAQRAAEAHRMTRSLKALQPFGDAFPQLMQALDTEKLSDELLDFAGLPKRKIPPESVVPGGPMTPTDGSAVLPVVVAGGR